MSHSYCSSLYHCVFSTKERRPVIDHDLQLRLWPYLGGIARDNGMKTLAVGGVEDHVHLLLSLPSTLAVAKAMQLIKGGSSKWVHDTFPQRHDFAWQEGYGAFSIGVSQIDDTKRYIENQAEHHRRHTFEEEFHRVPRTPWYRIRSAIRLGLSAAKRMLIEDSRCFWFQRDHRK